MSKTLIKLWVTGNRLYLVDDKNARVQKGDRCVGSYKQITIGTRASPSYLVTMTGLKYKVENEAAARTLLENRADQWIAWHKARDL